VEDEPGDLGGKRTVWWDTTGVPGGTYAFLVEAKTAGNVPVRDTSLENVGTSDVGGIVTVKIPNVEFAKQAGGPGSDVGNGVATFEDGSFVVTGTFAYDIPSNRGEATFGPGETGEQTLEAPFDGSSIFVARYNADGSLAWARQVEGNDFAQSEEGRAVATFPDGSCVVTGWFQGLATFGISTFGELPGFPGEPGIGLPISLNSDGDSDIFVARYNADGGLVWARRAGSKAADGGLGIASFADGSCVVTGWFQATATFGPGEVGSKTLAAGGGDDVFVARYDVGGKLVWAKRAGGAAGDRGEGVASFADGSCVVTGWSRSATFTCGEGEPTETTLPGGTSSAFIARYEPDGSLAWVKNTRGGYAQARAVAVLADGSCAITGSINTNVTRPFFDFVTFGAGEPDEATLFEPQGGVWSGAERRAFVANYRGDGTLAWVRRIDQTRDGRSRGAGVAPLPDGSLVVAEHATGAVRFGVGDARENHFLTLGLSQDSFIARYSATGGFIWARVDGCRGFDTCEAVAAFPGGAVVATGSFRLAPVFDPGTFSDAPIVLESEGRSDIFVARYGLGE